LETSWHLQMDIITTTTTIITTTIITTTIITTTIITTTIITATTRTRITEQQKLKEKIKNQLAYFLFFV
jgi:hypothetical protein